MTGASCCSGSSGHGSSSCGNDSLNRRRCRIRDRQDAQLTGASCCNSSSSCGSSGCGNAGLVAAVMAVMIGEGGEGTGCMINKTHD